MSFFYKISLTSFVFALLGISTFFFLPQLIQYVINKKIQLSEGSILYPIWKDPPIEIHQSFYFFNVTNSYYVEKHGAKPQLDEIGPFTYRISVNKVVSKVKRDNDSICFREIRSYHFIRSLSVADDTTRVTTLNAPLIIALNVLAKLPHWLKEILEEICRGFFVTKSVRELTFAGYPDYLMDFSRYVIPKAKDRYKGKFGYLVGFNSSDDGDYCVNSGIDNIMKINLIQSVNGRNTLNLWPGSSCNSFNSSTRGEVSPPMREGPRKSIQIFVPFFCRKFDLIYQKVHRISSGLETLKYYLDPLNFANSSIYPPNSCYVPKKGSSPSPKGQKIPSGVFDISPCQYGCPLFLSKPHFLEADPYYLSTVQGLNPNISRHESWVEVEPVSGTSAQVMMRFQANLRTSKKPDLLQAYKIPDMIFPVFWMELSYLIDKNLRQELFIANEVYNLLPSVIFISFVSFSILLILIAFVKFLQSKEGAILGFKRTFLFWRQSETDQQLLVEPDGDENETTEEDASDSHIPQSEGERPNEILSARAH
ncbi:scavenger receptor class B member 1-like [Brevipalpus obovatus]|uniref:scavenger receptor class B member 1-like n=1 Tax=Brevipalpus obovatus TaxID=246614 RepID=UPI003D9E99CE